MERQHMPSKRISNSEPDDAVYISARQVCQRYGGLSMMWLERKLQRDTTFPQPHKFGERRFFKLEDLVAWERKAAVKSKAKAAA
jgi:predicted DNA-binding transcriptional regulator AlpA